LTSAPTPIDSLRREPRGINGAPQPDVRVHQKFHPFQASQSAGLPVAPTISPRISAVPAMHPRSLPVGLRGEGGMISATGCPNRVTLIGWRVFRTSSSMPRHLALNWEIATSFIRQPYRGQRPWSNLDMKRTQHSADRAAARLNVNYAAQFFHRSRALVETSFFFRSQFNLDDLLDAL